VKNIFARYIIFLPDTSIEFIASVYFIGLKCQRLIYKVCFSMNSIVKFSLYVSLSYSVMLYFKCNGHLSMYSFSSSPRRRFSYKPKYRAKIFFSLFLFLTTLLLALRISLLFFNQSQKNFTDPGLHKIRHSSLVCCRGLALLHFFALATLTFLGWKVTELIIDNQLSSTIELK